MVNFYRRFLSKIALIPLTNLLEGKDPPIVLQREAHHKVVFAAAKVA
jgi:hypothetical protein